MPVEAKPLFRPEVLRGALRDFELPRRVRERQSELAGWVQRLRSVEGMKLKESEIIDRFIQFAFIELLGYTGAEHSPHTLSREKHVEVEGSYADAVLGRFGSDEEEFVIAFEGKSPADPLDRPYKGRRLSAVEQAYQYAINLPCDWLIVSSILETRLYYKGADQHTYERFRLSELAEWEVLLKKFIFLLGAERCVPTKGECHLYRLLEESEIAGRAVTRDYYQRYTEIRYDIFRHLCRANPDAEPKRLLAATQKLLDRILFCAFCQDRGLLPIEILRRSYEAHNPFHPVSVWENFKGLFRYIDGGDLGLRIPAYDGSLFAPDEFLHRLNIPDEACALFKELGEYDYQMEINGGLDARRQVDVEILGHIFEQSITDLERLYREIEEDGGGLPDEREKTRRQKEGAFYTPQFITRYIVGNTLDPVLDERFERLRRSHVEEAKGTAVKVLSDPRVFDADALNSPQRKALRRFWEAWLEELRTVRILDPACGSGAFLIEAFDQIFAAYRKAGEYLADLTGQERFYDVDRRILKDNLYGVDLNEEAIQICRLSLWIKTAKRDRPLTSLDHTIRVGNSIVDDAEVAPKAFDWRAAFPEVFEAGGFDVVLGNPPYLRQELLRPIKPYLKKNYEVYHGMADLYAYFFEKGLSLLRPGGFLSFVVTNKWLRANYASKLRRLLAEGSFIQSAVDLGHAKQIFPDADVFPSVLVTRLEAGESRERSKYVRVCSIPRDQLRIDNLQQQFKESGGLVERAAFGEDPWLLESQACIRLIERLREANAPLAEFAGATPYRGVLTGFNEAFLVDGAKRKKLIEADPGCESVIKPFVRGQDIGRWACRWDGLWMIVIESSANRDWPWAASDEPFRVFSQQFPSIADYFHGMEEPLRKRQDQGDFWWELRSCSYWEIFERPKLLYQVIQYHPRFGLDEDGLYSNDKTFMLPSDDLYLLGVLNSPLMWWHNWRTLQHLKDEALSPMAYMVEQLPIAEPGDELRRRVEKRVRKLADSVRARNEKRASLRGWLRSEFEIDKLGNRLGEPDALELEGFLAEVRKRRGKKPLSAAGLEALKKEYARSVEPMRAEEGTRRRLEREVSDLVNKAYGLTPEEVDLMWKTAPPRMPIDSPPEE